MPVAVYCRLKPAGTLALIGVTSIDCKTGAAKTDADKKDNNNTGERRSLRTPLLSALNTPDGSLWRERDQQARRRMPGSTASHYGE
jgi:hypothetical protein